jgi:thioredoxin 1
MIKHLTDANFNAEIAAQGAILVDFHAQWCGPCRMLAPILEQLDREMKGKVCIAKIDIEAEPVAAANFQVSSVPTLILFQNGKEANRLIGLRNFDAIKNFLDAALHPGE